jgi:hypothetical protein
MKLRACAFLIAFATYRKHLISPQTSSNFRRQQRFESLTIGNSNNENVYIKHMVPRVPRFIPMYQVHDMEFRAIGMHFSGRKAES